MGPYGQLSPSQGQQGLVAQHLPLPVAGQDGSSFGQQALLSGQGDPQFGQQMPLLGQQFGQQVPPLPGQYVLPFGQQAPLHGQYWPAFGQQGTLPGQEGPTYGQQGPLPGQEGPTYGQPAPQPGEQGATGGQQGPVDEQGLAAGIPPDGGSSSSSRVRYGEDKATAVAAAHGAFRGGQAQTNVQGGSSRDGSFQAHAQSEFDFGQVDSQVRGYEGQATSLAESKVTGVANTRTHTRLNYGGTGEAHARGTSPQGLTVAQTEGLGRRGQASSRARGIGMTSSQAQVGDVENATRTTTNADGDVQEVSASSQGGFFQGNSQSHVRGRGQTNAASARSAFGQDAERDFADEDRTGADSPPSAIVLPDGTISQTVPQPGTDSATPPDGTSTVYQLGPSYFTLVDPRTGTPGVVDPRTALTPVDRAGGAPVPVDPRTGLPIPVDPRVPPAWSQPGLPVPGQDPQVPFTGHSSTGFKAKPKLPHLGQHSVPIGQYQPIDPHQEQQFPQTPVSHILETKQKTAFQPHYGETQPPLWQHGQIKPKDPYLYGGQGQPMHKSSGMDYIQKLKAGLGKSITQQQHYLQAQQQFVGQPLANDQCIYETGKRCTQGYKMTNTVRLCVPLCAV